MILGMTSWQVPGTYLENVNEVHEFTDFIELLVYTWDDTVEDMLNKEMTEIDKKVKYSVHLPTDTLENCRKAMNYFRDKEVYRLTIHPMGDDQEFIETIKYGMDIYGRKICIENLENELFYRYYKLVEKQRASITMDYGHLLMTEENPQTFFNRYSSYIKEIHFHGVDNGKGHTLPTDKQYKDFLKFHKRNIKDKDIPVCIELFKIDDTKEVYKRLKNK